MILNSDPKTILLLRWHLTKRLVEQGHIMHDALHQVAIVVGDCYARNLAN